MGVDEGDQVAGRSPRVAAQGFCFWNSGDPSARRYRLSAPSAGGPGGGGEQPGTAGTNRDHLDYGCPGASCSRSGYRGRLQEEHHLDARARGAGRGTQSGSYRFRGAVLERDADGKHARDAAGDRQEAISGGFGEVITFARSGSGAAWGTETGIRGGLGDRNRGPGRHGTPTKGSPRAGEAIAGARKRNRTSCRNRRERFLRIESVLVRTNSSSPQCPRDRQRAPAVPQ